MDKDLGEMFLNFPLPKKFQDVSGVNLREFKDQLSYVDGTKRKRLFWAISKKKFNTHWSRCWMGFCSSPDPFDEDVEDIVTEQNNNNNSNAINFEVALKYFRKNDSQLDSSYLPMIEILHSIRSTLHTAKCSQKKNKSILQL